MVARHGDAIVAVTAAILHTPFDTCRRTPILLLLRMYRQAERIARATRPHR
jgi:hypothetical protein